MKRLPRLSLTQQGMQIDIRKGDKVIFINLLFLYKNERKTKVAHLAKI